MLTQDRGQVLCLAHALETYKTLSGEDVVAVIERTRGPLVDGRQYGQPGFTAELEDYHRAAMSAHREHSTLRLSMPALPPVAWVPEAVPAGPPGPAPATPGAATPNGGPEPGAGPVLGS
jgi:cell division protease FtsH